MTAEEFVAEGPRRSARRRRRRRRLGLSFRQGPIGHAGFARRGRLDAMASPSRSSPRSRTAPERQPASSPRPRSARLLSRATSPPRRAVSGALCGLRARSFPGQRLGRTLGVPTANIALEPTNRLAHGVYAVVSAGRGARFSGRRQLRRPADRRQRAAAARGSSARLSTAISTGGRCEVEFVERIRDERKFDSIAALVSRDGARQGAGPRHPRREGA